MTFTNTDTKAIFQGNGSTTTFAIPSDFASNSEIEVWERDESVSEPIETQIVSGFTITGGNPGTNVVFTTPPVATVKILLRRIVPLTQPTDYDASSEFPAETHESALDNLTRQIQQIEEKLSRAIVFKKTTAISNVEIDKITANRILEINSAADGVALVTPDSIASQVTLPTLTANRAVNTDGAGGLAASVVTKTEQDHLTGVTSNIQAQINAAGGGGTVSNLGLDLTSGILKVVQGSGSDLSVSNPGTVIMPNTTNGLAITLPISRATYTLEDASGTSQMTGSQFGVLTGVAWDEDRPFYLYACNFDNTGPNVEFFMSPNPTLQVVPATIDIGFHDTVPGTPSDNNVFFFTSTDVSVTHQGKPCIRVAGVRAQMSASDDWTFQVLNDDDGFRANPYASKLFDMPAGQGSIANEFFESASAPTWATQADIVYKYNLNPITGYCHIHFDTSGAGAVTNGGSALVLGITMPYKPSIDQNVFGGRWSASGHATTASMAMVDVRSANRSTFWANATGDSLRMDDFSNGANDIFSTWAYQAFAA